MAEYEFRRVNAALKHVAYGSLPSLQTLEEVDDRQKLVDHATAASLQMLKQLQHVIIAEHENGDEDQEGKRQTEILRTLARHVHDRLIERYDALEKELPQTRKAIRDRQKQEERDEKARQKELKAAQRSAEEKVDA